MKVAIFISSTNDIWTGQDYTQDITYGLIDMFLNHTAYFDVDRICQLPQTKRNDLNTKQTQQPANCSMSSNSYNNLIGNYQHPTFGIVNVNHSGNALQFNYGVYGIGHLCQFQNEIAEDTYQFFVSNSSLMNSFSNFLSANGLYMNVTFVFSSDSTSADSLLFRGLDPSASPPPMFERVGGPTKFAGDKMKLNQFLGLVFLLFFVLY